MSATRAAPDPAEKRKGRGPRAARKERTRAEWFSLSLSVTIVMSMAGLAVYAHLVRPNQPPVIEVLPLPAEARAANGLHYLPVEVTNSGGQTAEALVVNLTLNGDAAAETAQLAVPFLADGETVRGVVTFSRPPGEGELTVTFSYLEP